MLRIIVALLLSLIYSEAFAQCPTPTTADAGKICVVQPDGSLAWSPAIIVDAASGKITLNAALMPTIGMICSNNVRCLSALDAFGVEQNFFYLDNAQNMAVGPGHDRGVTSFVALNAYNFFLNDTTYNFEGTSWPLDKLSFAQIGAGCSIVPGSDNNMLLVAPPGSGSGCVIMSTNRHTNTSYPFALRFLLAVDDDTYNDLQFGVRDASGNSEVRFRLGSGSSGHSTLDCTVTNGGATHTISTSYTRGSDRRVFDLYFPPQSASPPDNQVALLAANSNNESVDASPPCNFPLSDAAMPSGGANLLAFLQFRNYDTTRSRTLNLGKIRFRSGF